MSYAATMGGRQQAFAGFGAAPVLDPYRYNQPGRGSLLGSNETSVFGGDQTSPASLLDSLLSGAAPGVTTAQGAGPSMSPPPLSDSGTVSSLAAPPAGFLGIPWLGWAMIVGGTLLVFGAGHLADDRRLIEKEETP